MQEHWFVILVTHRCSAILSNNDHTLNKSFPSGFEHQTFSQNGEDGIVDYLLNRLNIIKPKFIEIGVGDFSECNTRYIYKKN